MNRYLYKFQAKLYSFYEYEHLYNLSAIFSCKHGRGLIAYKKLLILLENKYKSTKVEICSFNLLDEQKITDDEDTYINSKNKIIFDSLIPITNINTVTMQKRLINELTNKLESQTGRDNNIPESYKDLVKVSYDYLNNHNIDRLNEYLNNVK